MGLFSVFVLSWEVWRDVTQAWARCYHVPGLWLWAWPSIWMLNESSFQRKKCVASESVSGLSATVPCPSRPSRGASRLKERLPWMGWLELFSKGVPWAVLPATAKFKRLIIIIIIIIIMVGRHPSQVWLLDVVDRHLLFCFSSRSSCCCWIKACCFCLVAIQEIKKILRFGL